MLIMVIPADWEEPVRREEIEDSFESYQTLVEGYIEFVDTPTCSLIVNEEGMVFNLPMNERATAFLWRQVPHHIMQTVIMGGAVVVGPETEDGALTSCPEAIFAEFGV
jgi:hypothetical protein